MDELVSRNTTKYALQNKVLFMLWCLQVHRQSTSTISTDEEVVGGGSLSPPSSPSGPSGSEGAAATLGGGNSEEQSQGDPFDNADDSQGTVTCI